MRAQQIAARDGPLGARDAGIGGFFPFPKPGLVVVRVDPARGEKAFGYGRAAFLSRSQEPHEFSRKLFVVGPVDPSRGIELRSQVKGPFVRG